MPLGGPWHSYGTHASGKRHADLYCQRVLRWHVHPNRQPLPLATRNAVGLMIAAMKHISAEYNDRQYDCNNTMTVNVQSNIWQYTRISATPIEATDLAITNKN